MPRKRTKAQEEPETKGNLTPYNGKKRCFGHFKCPDCKRAWQSGYSWANTAQKCKKCKIYVYPYRQEPLKKVRKKDDHRDPRREHPQSMCGKCRSLGFPCRELENDDDF